MNTYGPPSPCMPQPPSGVRVISYCLRMRSRVSSGMASSRPTIFCTITHCDSSIEFHTISASQ